MIQSNDFPPEFGNIKCSIWPGDHRAGELTAGDERLGLQVHHQPAQGGLQEDRQEGEL